MEYMNALRIVTIGFLIMELTNVITLYFFPGSTYTNGVGIFNAWEKSKLDPDVHAFVKYLVNWVAGSKLIFILLLIVILYTVDDDQFVFVGLAMTVSILSFFWRLFPLVRKMDKANEISPKNYSIGLGWMIFAMISAFVGATLWVVLG